MSKLTIHTEGIDEPKPVTKIHLLKLIPQQSQRQDSVIDQLKDLRLFANKLGMYDAADYLQLIINKGDEPVID